MSDFADREPVVAGKPNRGLFDEARSRAGAHRPLIVGDRLDSDIRGAAAAGIDSLLVLTGVTGLHEPVSAQAANRPSYVSPDLGGLFPPRAGDALRRGLVLGRVDGRAAGGGLRVTGRGGVDVWWRAVAEAAWDYLDETRRPVDVTGIAPPPEASGRSI